MKTGQTIYYCWTQDHPNKSFDNNFSHYWRMDFADCKVVNIHKNGNVRVKVFNDDGKELNDFAAPRKCFCVTKKALKNRIESDYKKKIARLDAYRNNMQKIFRNQVKEDLEEIETYK